MNLSLQNLFIAAVLITGILAIAATPVEHQPAPVRPKQPTVLGDYALCFYDWLATPLKPMLRLWRAIGLAFSEWCGCFDDDWVEALPEQTVFDDMMPEPNHLIDEQICSTTTPESPCKQCGQQFVPNGAWCAENGCEACIKKLEEIAAPGIAREKAAMSRN
jgi:hypothetical protein